VFAALATPAKSLGSTYTAATDLSWTMGKLPGVEVGKT